jgi:hypothetical protein
MNGNPERLNCASCFTLSLLSFACSLVGTSEGLFSFEQKLRIIVAMTFWSLAGMWLIWCLRGGQNSAQYREATREPQSVTKTAWRALVGRGGAGSVGPGRGQGGAARL